VPDPSANPLGVPQFLFGGLFVRAVQRNVPSLGVTIQFESRPPNPVENLFAVALTFWPVNVSNHIFPFVNLHFVRSTVENIL
jgi:hypothetical protein